MRQVRLPLRPGSFIPALTVHDAFLSLRAHLGRELIALTLVCGKPILMVLFCSFGQEVNLRPDYCFFCSMRWLYLLHKANNVLEIISHTWFHFLEAKTEFQGLSCFEHLKVIWTFNPRDLVFLLFFSFTSSSLFFSYIETHSRKC